ncbi:MAG: DNA-binding transcriptional regulator [Planctomycetia bacterium]|nr:DNA-binding transcriptional regulator [Planctomycetia bacterium]
MKRIKREEKQRTKERKIPARDVLLLVEPSRTYGQGIILGATRYALERGPWIIRVDEEINMLESILHRIREWEGDGMIVRTTSLKVARELEKFRCPIVELGGDDLHTIREVQNDNVLIAQMAADHLLGLGFRHFGFYSFGEIAWIRERRDAFQDCIEKEGYSVQQFSQAARRRDYIHPLWTLQFEKDLGDWLLRLPKPIAIWAASDRQAVHIQERCLRLQIDIPEEIALLGTDDDPILCGSLTPPLSSIRTDTVRIGYEAAALLDRRMKKLDLPEDLPIRIPPVALVARQSTDITSVEDPDIREALGIIRERAVYGLSVSELAKVLCLSENTIRRRFIKYLGRTPDQEMKRIRIERAKELLSETDLGLAEITELTGFGAPEYFAKSFLKETGLTPYQFRKKMKEGK